MHAFRNFSMKWTLSEQAYLVGALHFAKHASGDVVFGLLIGKGSQVVEAVPLFHSFVLAPSLMVGLSLTAEYAKKKGLEIVGAYSKTLPALKYAIATISQKTKTEPLALLFSEKDLQRDACMFKSINDTVEIECAFAKAHGLLKDLVDKDVYMKLIDLDEHFVDPVSDFLGNTALVVN